MHHAFLLAVALWVEYQNMGTQNKKPTAAAKAAANVTHMFSQGAVWCIRSQVPSAGQTPQPVKQCFISMLPHHQLK
jgi:hypothetical protein